MFSLLYKIAQNEHKMNTKPSINLANFEHMAQSWTYGSRMNLKIHVLTRMLPNPN